MYSVVMYVPCIPNNAAAPTRRRVASAARPRCFSMSKPIADQTTQTMRRSGNYRPPFWDFNTIQSVTSQFTDERYSARAADLILQVKKLLLQMEGVGRLELIDDLQRLGISYHFHDEINQILNLEKGCFDKEGRDLYSTALAFRLLRQHGFQVSQEVFDCFKNERGEFRSSLNDDTRGMLQLYEASFLLTEGEEGLEVAKEFATNSLQKKVVEEEGESDESLLASVRDALRLPIHWRIQRPTVRWFIDAYEKRERPQMNPLVLELAKLDFNMIQAIHQEELKVVSKWWNETRLAEKLPFARDRVVECYLWTLGELVQPEFEYARITFAKINVLITIIDDIFDVYGTLEELHLFNYVIQRWDVEAIDKLPDYMQTCFLTLNSFVNDTAFHIHIEQGVAITPHLRKAWKDLCRTYTREAEWYAAGYKPTLDEYINNAWISISAPVILCHVYFLVTNPINNEAVESLYKYHEIVRLSAMILRLANDLGTSPFEMERGDVPKWVQCYMNENGAAIEEAQDHVKLMIWESWKKMNGEIRVKDLEFSQEFVIAALDLAKMAQYINLDGDGHGRQDHQIKDRFASVLFEPVI